MNVLTITGHLTGDPARRDTTKGVVCDFRVAVDGPRRLWLPVSCWGHLAGTCKRYLRLGRRVAISGQLCVDEYISGNDTKQRWYLRATQVTFLDGPPADDTDGDSTDHDNSAIATPRVA